MPPSTSAGREVPPTGIPFGIGHSVVVRSTQVLDTATPRCTLTAGFVGGEVEIPEFQLRLGRRPNRSEHDVPTTRRPPDSVTGPSRKGLEQLEITLTAFVLVEANIGLDGDTWTGVAEVGIAAGHEGETLSFGFPGEVGHGVCRGIRTCFGNPT